MSLLQKFRFMARLMSDPDLDRLYRRLKEGGLEPLPEELEWWRKDAAFLRAHSAEEAVKNGMRLGARAKIEPGVIFMGHPRIRIGDDFVCSFGATVRAVDADIMIGDQVNVGPLVCIIGANHGTAAGAAIQDQPHESAEVKIGSDVWIGSGAIILPGSTVGDGAVIGAGSVVTGDIPPGMIAAGAPARPTRSR